MSKYEWYMLGWFCITTLAGIVSMAVDKNDAKKHRRRISENMLFFWALIGGAFGSYIGMTLFNHKTNHPKFKFGMPLMMLLNAVMYYYIRTKF